MRLTIVYLEVYDDSKDKNSGHQIHQVGQILSVERLTESSHFVLSRGQQVEQGNHGSFEFCSTSSVDGRRTKCLPNNRLTNIGCNEERNPTPWNKNENNSTWISNSDGCLGPANIQGQLGQKCKLVSAFGAR